MNEATRNLKARRNPNDSLATLVASDLLARIERNDLTPGARLPSERELMAAYGVSRTVVREAISSLRSSGRVATQQGRGAFVLAKAGQPGRALPLDARQADSKLTQLQLLEVRIGIETEAAALAAMRRTELDLRNIEQSRESLAIAMDGGSSIRRKDVDFHMAIAKASKNGYFVDIFAALLQLRADKPMRQFDSMLARRQHIQFVRAEHAQIVQAIADGDAESARAAMRLHLANSARRTAELYDTQLTPSAPDKD